MARRVHRERVMSNSNDEPTTLPFIHIGPELVAMLRPYQRRRIQRDLARAERRVARAVARQVSRRN